MHVSRVRLLRRLLIALIAAVVLAVLVNYIHNWRLRSSERKPDAEVLSPEWIRSADTLEYSSYENGTIKFRLSARKLLETREGKRVLQGIDANDFNPDGSIRNHISSENAEYDEGQKLAYFFGNVRILLGKDVELRLESLHYNLNEEVGYSEDPLQVQSPQAHGTARGIRYDNAHRQLELRNDLDFVIHRPASPSSVSPGPETYRLTAARGSYSETGGSILMEGSARLVSAAGSLSGDRIEATFTGDKRLLTGLSSEGDAVYHSSDAAGVRTLSGGRIEFGISAATRALKSIDVRDGAGFLLESASGTQKLTGRTIHLQLDETGALPRQVHSETGVVFEMERASERTAVSGEWLEASFDAGGKNLEIMHVRDHAALAISSGGAGSEDLKAGDIRIAFRTVGDRSAPMNLEASEGVVWRSPPRTAQGGRREPGRSLTSDSLAIHYTEKGDSLQAGTATGRVVISTLPETAGAVAQVRRLESDKVDFGFFPGSSQLRSLVGNGHVQVHYRDAPAAGSDAAEEFHTSSTSIDAGFRERDGAVESIRQEGNFTYQDGVRTATAGRCRFASNSGLLVLEDHPIIRDAVSSTEGETIDYDQKLRIVTVHGNVRSILREAQGGSPGLLISPASSSTSSPTVVTARQLKYWSKQDRFLYSDDVTLLSTQGQLEAASLDILDSGSRILAAGKVRHRILGLRTAVRGKGAGGRDGSIGAAAHPRNDADIRCARLEFTRAENRIQYLGGVFLETAEARLWSDTLDVYLDAAGNQVDHAAAHGKLRIDQAGRQVKGDDADYYLESGTFVVTGDPAEIFDSGTGARSFVRQLTFFTADDRILLGRRTDVKR